MKTLLIFQVSFSVFQALLFASTATGARCSPTLSLNRGSKWSNSDYCGFMEEGFGGRHTPSPPPPPHYSPGPVTKLKSPTTATATGRRHSPPPPPHYSPGPIPTRTSPPALKDLLYQKSLPNPYAVSA